MDFRVIKQFLFPWLFPPQFVLEAALAVGAIAGAITAGVSVKNSIDQRKQAKLAQHEAEAQQRITDMQNQKAAREQLRKERIAKASVINAAANSGTTGSTGELGAIGSLGSESASNIGMLQSSVAAQSSVAGDEAQRLEISKGMATSSMIGGVAGAVGGVANGVFEGAGGYESLFASNPNAAGTTGELFGNSSTSIQR
jgi:hypothetical protein